MTQKCKIGQYLGANNPSTDEKALTTKKCTHPTMLSADICSPTAPRRIGDATGEKAATLPIRVISMSILIDMAKF